MGAITTNKYFNCVINLPINEKTPQNCDLESFRVLIDTLSQNENIVNYWGIIHDKDINENGELKRVHLHLVIECATRVKFEDFLSYFKDTNFPENCISVDKVTSLKGSLLYLTHKSKPNKYQYDNSEIITNNFELYTENTLTEKEIFNILTKENSIVSVCDQIGIKKGNQYKGLFKEIQSEKRDNLYSVKKLGSEIKYKIKNHEYKNMEELESEVLYLLDLL